MRRWKASLILPLAILLIPASTPAESEDPDPASQLMRLSEAIKKAKKEARFEAEQTVFAFSRNKTVVTRFKVQYAYPYRKRECIEGPEENRFVTFEDEKHIWTYFPARKLVVKEPLRDEDSPFPLRPTEDLDFLMKNYRFQVVGPVPTEGGQCRVVSFIPKQGDRPRREWWLEERWNVPVRVNVSSSEGKPAYMKQLRDIRWNAELEPESIRLRVPRDSSIVEVREQENLTIEEAQRMIKRNVVLPYMIPVGYRPHDVVVRWEQSRVCLQIIYSDGLSSVSFFQTWPNQETKKSQTDPQPSTEGIPPAFTTWQRGGINIITVPGPGGRAVLVGDVHKDRLTEMAESFRSALRESLRKTLSESLHQKPPIPASPPSAPDPLDNP